MSSAAGTMKPVRDLPSQPHRRVQGILPLTSTRNGIPWRLVDVDRRANRCRPTPAAFAGLVFMGGPMSVNDDLPWIAPVLALIRRAVDAGGAVPRPLPRRPAHGEGARRRRSRATRSRRSAGGRWRSAETPRGARVVRRRCASSCRSTGTARRSRSRRARRAILASPYCANQAFVLGHASRHAMPRRDDARADPRLVRRTRASEVRPHARAFGADRGAGGRASRANGSRDLNAVAARLYDRWIEGLGA